MECPQEPGDSPHFGKVTRPDGVMLQLGQRSSDRDVWPVPTGNGHNQIRPWSLGPGAEPVVREQRAALHQRLAESANSAGAAGPAADKWQNYFYWSD